jgi:RNA polymerase sigma-70 factor (ECF subfamily)
VFRELVDRHYGSVWACVSVLTGRSADTEDLVHQAFLLAFERLADGGGFAGDPGKWLRGTARHLVFAWWREKRRLPEAVAGRLEALAARQEEDAFSRADRAEIRAALRECLAKLSEEERRLVHRRYEEDEGLARIAESLGLNAVTIRTRLHRIRQALRRCLATALSGGFSHGA